MGSAAAKSWPDRISSYYVVAARGQPGDRIIPCQDRSSQDLKNRIRPWQDGIKLEIFF